MFLRDRERDRETGRQSVSGEGQRERETQNPKQALVSELSAQPYAGLKLRNQLSHPGTPEKSIYSMAIMIVSTRNYI